MDTKLNVVFSGEDILSLHKEIGKGNLEDGRICRLIQTNTGISLQVTNKNGKGWKTFFVSYFDLTKAISEVVPKLEKELKG